MEARPHAPPASRRLSPVWYSSRPPSPRRQSAMPLPLLAIGIVSGPLGIVLAVAATKLILAGCEGRRDAPGYEACAASPLAFVRLDFTIDDYGATGELPADAEDPGQGG